MVWIEILTISGHSHFFSWFGARIVKLTATKAMLTFKMNIIAPNAFLLSGHTNTQYSECVEENKKGDNRNCNYIRRRNTNIYQTNDDKKCDLRRINKQRKKASHIFRYLRILFSAFNKTIYIISILCIDQLCLCFAMDSLLKRLIHQLLFDKLMCQYFFPFFAVTHITI